jgi:hypothetical protein
VAARRATSRLAFSSIPAPTFSGSPAAGHSNGWFPFALRRRASGGGGRRKRKGDLWAFLLMGWHPVIIRVDLSFGPCHVFFFVFILSLLCSFFTSFFLEEIVHALARV